MLRPTENESREAVLRAKTVKTTNTNTVVKHALYSLTEKH